ncbi:MAG: V-type ATP synthase subunit A [Candidatus Hodarchaeales archaeon]|jgi:V/A-type H+-transporting ATPase subunit A
MSQTGKLGTIVRISGPVVDVEGLNSAQLYEIVRAGKEKLIGEIIRIRFENDKHISTVQVYEQTEGLIPGEPVEASGQLLSVELGPGILEEFFDGIQRPLSIIQKETGSFIQRGVVTLPLDHKRKWEFTPTVKPGEEIGPGKVIGEVTETILITHRILLPPNAKPGKIKAINSGTYTLDDPVGNYVTNDGKEIPLMLYHHWPVRIPRPFVRKEAANVPLITGQRIFDTFFPIAKGGVGAIPGAFGTGKTVSQHQLAKWSDSKVVVYVGCGERGNEMAEVLKEFPELKDPYSGEPLMKRTTLIANTSNMPVAAREASIYVGMTLAEYYRDQGYDVSLMADSTSRWAEALREVSGRLEEMPGEESYPAYLASRIAEFYERAGRVTTLNDEKASISAVGAVSPPGGDFSEPVTQYTLRTVRVFWALDKKLANARHFPSINWLDSYSLYTDSLYEWFKSNVKSNFPDIRNQSMALLQKEKELQEIVQLIGEDALPDTEKMVLRTTKLIREAFLQQNAYSTDSFCPLEKQYQMLNSIMKFNETIIRLYHAGVGLESMMAALRPVITDINNFKWMESEEFNKKYSEVLNRLETITSADIEITV